MALSLNPLEIGECFRLQQYDKPTTARGLNPLEIGECFRLELTV